MDDDEIGLWVWFWGVGGGLKMGFRKNEVNNKRMDKEKMEDLEVKSIMVKKAPSSRTQGRRGLEGVKSDEFSLFFYGVCWGS